MVKRQAGGSWDTAKPTGEDEGQGWPHMPSPNRIPAAGPRASVEEPESSWNSTKCRLQKAALAEACRRLLGTREGQRRWAAGGPAVGGAQTGRRNYKGLRRSTKKVPTHCRLCHRALCVLDTGSDTSTERAVTCPFPSVSVVEPNTL